MFCMVTYLYPNLLRRQEKCGWRPGVGHWLTIWQQPYKVLYKQASCSWAVQCSHMRKLGNIILKGMSQHQSANIFSPKAFKISLHHLSAIPSHACSRLITAAQRLKAAIDLVPFTCRTWSRCRSLPPPGLHRHSSECFSFCLITPCFLSPSPR